MKSVSQVSKMSGVSVRTLHYYDSIGLLSPTERTDSGYRLYNDEAIEKLQLILLFRELEFSLADIQKIIHNEQFDIDIAIEQQLNLLKLRRARFDKLILLAEQIINKEDKTMDFSAFDKSKIENYENEVKEKWGDTEEYKEYLKKGVRTHTAEEGLMKIFAEFGEIKLNSPSTDEANALVEKLKQYITDNYYTCKNEVLLGLGQMYVSDERFKANIDNAGGEGTADFVCKAIQNYCE